MMVESGARATAGGSAGIRRSKVVGSRHEVGTRDSGFGRPLGLGGAARGDADGRRGGGPGNSRRRDGGAADDALDETGDSKALSEREIATLMRSAEADAEGISPGADTADQARVSVGLFG